MYKIELKPAGFFLTFEGFVKADEMQRWLDEARTAVAKAPPSFGVIVDMTELKPLPPDAGKIMEEGQELFRSKGMTRSFVAVNNSITAMQFKRIAMESKIRQSERYVDASATPNWQKAAVDWVKSGIDPDKA
jgi:hypothetical protein